MNIVKELKWPMVLVIVSVSLTIVVTFIGVIIMEIDKVTGEQVVTVEVNSKEIDANVQLETETKETKTYSTSISYPITNKQEIDKLISDWKKNEEINFIKTIEESEDKADHSSGIHTMDIDANLYKTGKNLYSVLFVGEKNLKNDKSKYIRKMITFDLENEIVLDLGDLFQLNDDFITEALHYGNRLENEPNIDQALLKSTILSEGWQTWMLADDELSLFFQENEVGEYDGDIQINIPIVKIHKLIKDHYRSALVTEEMQKEIDNQPRELDPNGKYIALTFDDGPDHEVTPRILETLKAFDAKATFYMLAKNVNKYPDVAKMVADSGHEIANHSITHPNLNTVTKARIIDELSSSQEQIEAATGFRPESFRPPYGEYNDLVLKHAKETNQIISMWTVDTLDWHNRNANRILEHVRHSTSGDIILMHDIHHTTADALPAVMEYLQNEGFEFVTVMELVNLEEEVIEVGPYYGHKVSDEEAF